MKKILTSVIAVLCLTTVMATSVFAASSPEKGQEVTTNTGTYVVTDTTTNTVTYEKPAKTTNKINKVASAVTVSGKKYKVTKIKAKAFSKCTKIKKVKIYSKNLTSCAKTAFSGLSKAKLAKVKVVITKKMTAKNFKKLKKQLIAAGISAKNIVRSKIK